MQNKLEKLQHDLEGFEFVYQEAPHLAKKTHLGVNVSIKGDKFIIETDSRTFVIHATDIESFYSKCTFTGGKDIVSKTSVQNSPKKAEVFVPEACINLSDGLMDMFNKISSGKATKNDFEQAKSMSDIAGKIIDVEKVKLGYLALSKR